MNEAEQHTVTRAINLDHQETLVLEGRPGRRLRVLYGGAWLTAGNDQRQHFACAGEEVALRWLGRSTIESIGKSGIELTDPLQLRTLRWPYQLSRKHEQPPAAPAPRVGTLRDQLRLLGQRVAMMLATWLQRRRSRLELAGLDDHLLRDVGLTRADVLHEASKPFWRP
jgi:uncharacterized protein YjiS (DUF1127 family)